MSRMYAEAWKKLKERKHLQISAHPYQHKRIISGLRKERSKDTVYALLLSEQGLRERLRLKTSGSLIEFELQEKPVISVYSLFS